MDQLLYPDSGKWIDALQAGQQAGMTQRRNTAVRQAGGMMASGDYAGAAKAVYGEGDFSGGAAIAKYGQEQAATDRQSKFATALGSGDYQAAGQLAAADPTLHKLFTERLSEDADTMATYAQALKGMTPEDARAHYQQEILPALHQRGLRGPQYDAWDPTPQNIAQVETAALGLKEKLGLTRQAAVDAETARHNKATEDGYISVPEGGKLVPRHPGAGAPGQPSSAEAAQPEAPVPAGGIYAQVGQVATAKGAKPEEVSYLQRLAHVESHGDPGAQNDSSTGLFQFHPDTFAGAGGGDIHNVADQTAAALALSRRDRANLQQIGVQPTDANTYIMHQQGPGGGRALLTAPPEVGAVAVLTPVYGNAKIAEKAIVGNGGTADMTTGQFVDMWRKRWANGGRPVDMAAEPATTAPGAHLGDPAGTIYGDPKPVQWSSDGKGNLINKVTGDRKVDPTASADAVADPNLVKAIIEGRAPMPTANRAATDPKWQAAMAEAMAQDPTLDGANYGTRVKTRADFATGTAAKAKTALNTALGHAGDLYGQIDDLNNTGIHWLNSAVNKVGAANIDSRRASINTFNLTKEALMHEAMKVFSGSQGSMMEFKQLADTLTVDDGPETQHAVLKKLIGLLASKMDALGEQYKTGMGTELDQSQIMSPHAQQVFAKISGLPGDQVAPGATSKPGQPAAGTLPPQAVAQLKDGHDTTFGNGQVWTLRGGQPVRVK